ncbi:MAG: hypothetical protein Q8880_06080 [Bacteroidota bacterium]|nr:hypothetical protein [Bacteroidota bacterium]
MRKVLLLISFISIILYSYSQDIINKKNGEIINCKINKIDSANIYFKIKQNGNDISLIIDRKEILYYKYNATKTGINGDTKVSEQNLNTCLTIGLLQGGGSLIGADFEILLSKSVGIQVGAGIIGFGGGLDFHYSPKIRSTFFSFQYWHQGFGDSYAQSAVGPALVFRGEKWFTGQIGVGYIVDRGDALPEKYKDLPVMLTYSIGAYIPFSTK